MGPDVVNEWKTPSLVEKKLQPRPSLERFKCQRSLEKRGLRGCGPARVVID